MPIKEGVVPGGDPRLCHLITLEPDAYPAKVILPGGTFRLVHALGVTEAELQHARSHSRNRTHGYNALGSFFLHDDIAGPVTDGNRPCLTEDPDFPAMWKRALAVAEENLRI